MEPVAGIVLYEAYDERQEMTVYNRKNFFFFLLNKETDEQDSNTCSESQVQEKASKSDWLPLSGSINKNNVGKDILSKLMTYKSSRRKETFKK